MLEIFVLNLYFSYFFTHKHLQESLQFISPQIVFTELDESPLGAIKSDCTLENEFSKAYKYSTKNEKPFVCVDKESWLTLTNITAATCMHTLLLPLWPINAYRYYVQIQI